MLVLMPGSESFEVFARYLRRSPFTTLSDSFGMMVKTDLTVCSRTRGAISVKPVTCYQFNGHQSNIEGSLTNQIREDFVVDDLLGKMINHQWQTVK